MTASSGFDSDWPTPTPMTDGRDIRSLRRASKAWLARAAACSGNSRICPPEVVVDDPAAAAPAVPQVVPTKLTVLPSAVLTLDRTRPMGLPMVVLLLPAKSKATGWWQESLVTIREPESPPALKVV